MYRNRLFAIGFRGFCFALALAGLLAETGVFEGRFGASILMYYTIQSNLLGIFLFGLLLARTVKGYREDGITGKTDYYPRFEMIATVDLLLTPVVYWLLLAPTIFSSSNQYGLWTFGNLCVHLATPLFCLADYLFFARTPHLKYRDAYLILLYPLAYVAVNSIVGALGYVYRTGSGGVPVHYPYFFMDYDRIGWGALAYIGALIAAFLILSHALYLFDRKGRKTAPGAADGKTRTSA
ncbi:MAG TPA: Pr6Pr family membrane protein [Clostridia bacterium]|nr:Pr6Pr family membrane protein [Clostridia bacterium]